MKQIITSAGLLFVVAGFLVVGFVHAGDKGVQAPVAAPYASSAGCHGRTYSVYSEAAGGCASALLAPAYQTRGGCASASSRRVTLAERRLANQAARANAEATRAAFLKAAAKGDLETSLATAPLATMRLQEVDPATAQADGTETITLEKEAAPRLFSRR